MKKIKNTDLIEDIVCLNNKYVGVVYPYYDGVTLNQCMDYPIKSKIDMSRQIIENAKELTDNKIYPLDYKLNNMIYIDDKVKIIDLDDYYTKVKLFKSDRLLRKSNIILDETIKTFMGEYEYYSYIDLDLQKLLLKKKTKLNDNFEDISSYLDEKEKLINFLLVDLDTDISKIENLDDYLLLFVSDFVKNEDIISYIINNNINVYDVVRSNKLLKYLNNHSIDECVDKTGVKILKKIN